VNPAVERFIFVALPYVALVAFIGGVVWRSRSGTITSRSSKILESRVLRWGAIPFHLGIVILAVGHLVPLLAPIWWQRFVSDSRALLTVEAIGLGAGVLSAIGLTVLLARRLLVPSLRAVSTYADASVLALLLLQVLLGIAVAGLYRWGAVWSVRTTTPYLWSLGSLQPEPAFVAGAPLLVTFHLAAAWLILLLIPFTRLVHMFALPVGYLWRAPQRVIWVARRSRKQAAKETRKSSGTVAPVRP
jgi:nitrate reductase gamma subunit